MTPDDLKDIELDHEAVYHAQGWDIVVRERLEEGDVYVLPKLPDDVQRCVDAVPKLMAEIARRDAAIDALRVTLAAEHGYAILESPNPQMPTPRASVLAWALRLLDAARGVGHV